MYAYQILLFAFFCSLGKSTCFPYKLFKLIAASNELQCHDCDPNTTGGCNNPAENNVRIVNCQDLPRTLTWVKNQLNDIDKLDIDKLDFDKLDFDKLDIDKLDFDKLDIDKLDFDARGNPAERSFECFSLYLDAAPDSGIITGVYRGCNEKDSDFLSSCELLKDTLNTNTLDVVNCISCAEDKCNVHDVERGEAEVAVSLTIFNLMLCVMFVSILGLAFFCARVFRNH